MARASLRLRRGDPEDIGLQWKWGVGEATAAEVGDPTYGTGTSYALCIYDGSDNRVLSARAPAGTHCGLGVEDCWSSRSTKLSYRDDEMLPDGLQSISLGISGSDAKFKVKGAGESLDMPVLPLAFPLTVQLVNSDGSCWESAFQMDDMVRNDTTQLKARTK
jgi:hypothetical protein